MNIFHLAFAFVFLMIGSAASSAELVDCKGDNFVAANSLTQLPTEVVATLKAAEALADHGDRFSATDVLEPERYPSRRFSIGAVDNSRVFAAIEHGGDGYYIEIWEFENHGGHWSGTQRMTSSILPSSMPELLFVTCLGQKQPSPQKVPPQKSVSVMALPDGSIVLTLFSARGYAAYMLNRNGATHGTPKYNEITDYLHDNSVLSPEERSHLRIRLHELNESKDLDNLSRKSLKDFLQVLNSAH